MNETISNLTKRRSVRGFKPQQITKEQLDSILLAGTYAPTGRNAQSPLMVVVQNPKLLKQLSLLNAEEMGSDKDPFYGAPTVVIVFANTEKPTYLYDGTLVMGNLMNAAYSVGVDSCWIHRAKEVFLKPQGIELMKKWGIPDNYQGIGHCALGYCSGEYPKVSPRKDGYIVFAD